MPRCPLHVQEELEPKRKGWFCEECGAIVLDYDRAPLREGVASAAPEQPPTPEADSAREEITRPRTAVAAAPQGLQDEAEAATPPDGGLSWTALTTSSRRQARLTVERARRARRNPDLHVERAWFDVTLAGAASREGRALLVLGEPGTGKTTWACRLASSLLAAESDEDAVILVSGRDAWKQSNRDGSHLLSVLAGAAGIDVSAVRSPSELLGRLGEEREGWDEAESRSRRMILVLDGIDEGGSDTVLSEIDDLLEEVGRYAWLRVVVTMRRGAYEGASAPAEAGVGRSCPFRNVQWLQTFHDVATGRAAPFVEVRPWREETEARSAYEVMQRSSPETSASFRWDKLTPALRRLLCTPWCLPLFHDAFSGVDEAPSSLDAIGLTQAWFATIERTVPGAGALLDEMGSAAMHARHLEVGDEALSAWGKARGAEGEAAKAAVVGTGLLIETPAGVRFRHERVAEAVVARELMRRIAPRVVPSSDLLLTWAKSAGKPKGAEAFPALAGALEMLVTRWVTDGESGFVPALLDLEHADVRRRLVSASLCALGPGWGEQALAGPAATRLLEVLGTACSKVERLRRLLDPARVSVEWLITRGYLRAAEELVRRMASLVRGQVGRPLDAADRRLFGRALCELAQDAQVLGIREEVLRCTDDALRLTADGAAAEPPDAMQLRIRGIALALGVRMDAVGAARRGGRGRAEEALRASRKLVELDGDDVTLRRQLAQSLLALSDAALREGNAAQARGCAEEAGAVAREALERFGPDPELRRIRAAGHVALARVRAHERDAKGEREAAEAAVRSMRKLVRSEPQRIDYRLDLAGMLEGHAARLLAEHDNDLARRALDEASGLMIALVEAHPDQKPWLHSVAQLLVTLGLVLRARGESDSSRACFEEAVRHARTLAGRGDSPSARGELVMALAQLGHLEAVQGRRAEARRAFREAFEIVRGLEPSSSPFDELPRVRAMLLTALGGLAAEDGDAEGARWHLGEAQRDLFSWMAVRPARIDLQWELCHVMGVRAEVSGEGIPRPRRPARYRFAISVREPGVPEVKEYFDRDEITIGRAPGSDLMLPNYSVSRQHAVVRFEHGRFTITDLGSKHGTKVNGERVSGRAEVGSGDRVDLGDFALQLEPGPPVAQHEPADDEAPPSSDGGATVPPPPSPEVAAAPPVPTAERKEITIDLDVGDFVEVVDKVEDGP